MRATMLTRSLFLWMLTFSVMQVPVSGFADTPSEMDDCTQKALRSYFPEKFVKETLKKFHVPEDRWSTITGALTDREKDIEKNVEAKAEKMTTNPLKDPNQRQVAVKIFKETLYETASQVLKANGITDDKQIQDMVDDIQHQKARQFAKCIEKHKLPAMQMPEGSGRADSRANSGVSPTTINTNINRSGSNDGFNRSGPNDDFNRNNPNNPQSYSPSGAHPY